jgi:hypothetical protein
MYQCLTSNGNGDFIIASPQPTEYTTCVYVLAQPSDIANNAWALTAEQGSQLSITIGICWATAYAFRVVGQILNRSSLNESEN